MSINYTAIQAILDTQLVTLSTLPKLTLENIKANVDANVPFCRTSLIPAQAQVIGVGAGGWRMDQGLYQVDLFYPQNTGNLVIGAMADSVMNTFHRGTYYTSGNVAVLIDRVYRLPAGSLVQAAFYHLPVTVSWQYYDQS
jgi:hypothetical protein